MPPASLVAELWRDSPLRRTTYGIMFFFGLGTYISLLCWQSDLAGLLLWAGSGVVIGGIAARIGSRRGPELGLVPLGGLLLVVALVALVQGGGFAPWMGMAGAAGGLFLVPLQAYVRSAMGGARGWAAIGLLAVVGMLAVALPVAFTMYDVGAVPAAGGSQTTKIVAPTL